MVVQKLLSHVVVVVCLDHSLRKAPVKGHARTLFGTFTRYHPGRIQLVQRQANEPVYVVKFDDGESSGVLIDQMVLLPKPNTDGKFSMSFSS